MQLGICFCFAPLFHPAARRVATVRRRLGVPTIFNLLGPLANPAGATFQLLGVGKPHLRETLAEVLQLLGGERAVVVSGDDHLDKVTIAAPTRAVEVTAGRLRQLTWFPHSFGLARSSLDSLRVDGPAASAALIRGVLAGGDGAARDIVVANAGAALWTARVSDDLAHCAGLAAAAIDSGAPRQLLDRLVAMTNA